VVGTASSGRELLDKLEDNTSRYRHCRHCHARHEWH
jgi:hypothetical protein